MSPEYDIGMVHGRFQPFHNGHLNYFRDALKLTRQCLVVGVTNPDSASQSVQDSSDSHRHLPEANPFGFVDRARMISRSAELDLHHRGLPVVLIVPFNIHRQDTWGFLPRGLVQFVNVLEPWDELKTVRFGEHGFRVHAVPHGRVTSGEAVRDLLKQGRDLSGLVPAGTLEVLAAIHSANRQ